MEIFRSKEVLCAVKDYGTTLSKALEISSEARIICASNYPNNVVYANKAWTKMTNYEQHEIAGGPLSTLQGPLTNKDNILQMMHNLRICGFGSAEVINYDKHGNPFFCKISLEPIMVEDCFGDLNISHFLGVITDYEILDSINKLVAKIEIESEIKDCYNWMKKYDFDEKFRHELDTVDKEVSSAFSESELDPDSGLASDSDSVSCYDPSYKITKESTAHRVAGVEKLNKLDTLASKYCDQSKIQSSASFTLPSDYYHETYKEEEQITSGESADFSVYENGSSCNDRVDRVDINENIPKEKDCFDSSKDASCNLNKKRTLSPSSLRTDKKYRKQ